MGLALLPLGLFLACFPSNDPFEWISGLWLRAFWEMRAVSIQKKKERENFFIHSNSMGFVKLLLSVCHHKSHFDLVFFGAALPAQFCLLILHRTPREFGGPLRTHRGIKIKKQRPLFTETPEGLPLREEDETDTDDIKHTESLPVTAPRCLATLPGGYYPCSHFTGGELDTERLSPLPKVTQIVDIRARDLTPGSLTPGTRPKPPSRLAQTVKDPLAMQETRVRSLGREDPPGEGGWLPTPMFFPGEFHGQRSLVGYSPWDCKKLDMTE